MLSVLGSSDEDFGGSADGWCVGSCGNRSGAPFGFFLNSESSQANARGGASSLLLRVSPRRRAALLETLDDALTNAGLRMVGGRGNRIWFGTDGSAASNAQYARLNADTDGSGGVGAAIVDEGGAGANGSGSPRPSSGCIMASCMLGEGSVGGSASFVMDGNADGLFLEEVSQPSLVSVQQDVNMITNPEPGTIALMIGGLAALGLFRRRSSARGE